MSISSSPIGFSGGQMPPMRPNAAPTETTNVQRQGTPAPASRPRPAEPVSVEFEPQPISTGGNEENEAYIVELSGSAEASAMSPAPAMAAAPGTAEADNAALQAEANEAASSEEAVQRNDETSSIPTLRDTLKSIKQARQLVSYLFENILTQPQQAIAAQANMNNQLDPGLLM